MTIEHFNNEEQLGSVRNKINSNFTELDNRSIALSAQTAALSSAATDFVSLSDTPDTLDAGSYLRVNSTGDGVEQVKTAPPDGGMGDNSYIQSVSNFDGKLPDIIILSQSNGTQSRYMLNAVTTSVITYVYWTEETAAESWYVNFNNDATGSGMVKGGKTGSTSGWNPEGYTTLQQFIDNGRAVFYGQKSGISGAGSLSVIKSKAENFYTELPDAIVATVTSGWECTMRLKFAKNITDQPDGLNFWYEARMEQTDNSDADYFMVFKDDADGTRSTNTGQSDRVVASSNQNLRWFIENGRAIYHGGGASVLPAGSVIQKTVEKISSRSDISGVDTTLISTQFTPRSADSKLLLHFTAGTFAEDDNTVQQGAFWVDDAKATSTTDSTGHDWYMSPASTNNRMSVTAHAIHDNQDLNTKTIAMKLSLDNADRSDWHNMTLIVEEISNQPTMLETGAPVRGMSSGGASEFTSLTDTPSGFDAGSYLRVNAAGDAIEQVKTAPPDGGLGDNYAVQTASNFAGKLPDKLILKHTSTANDYNGGPLVFELRQVAASKIIYCDTFGDDGASKGYRVTFNNNESGDGWTTYGTHILSPVDGVVAPTLQQIIDVGRAVYHGQKSGTSGIGANSWLRQEFGTPKGSNNVYNRFYTDIPDCILMRDGDGAGGYWTMPLTISEIGYSDTSANPSGLYAYYRSTNDSYFAWFDLNTADGDYGSSTKIDSNEAFGTGPQTLRSIIEAGRALYYNSKSADNIQTGTYIGDGTTTQQVHLGFRPKMVTVKGVYSTDADTNSQYYFDQTIFDTITDSGDLIPREYTDGNAYKKSHITPSERVPFEITDTGFKIVGPTDNTPTNDSTPNHPGTKYHYFAIGKDVTFSEGGGGASEFTSLTDTPSGFDAGSYLRVNAAGDAIEQVKTAPPDGGLGDHSLIQEASKFDGKLPDYILTQYSGYTMPLVLRSVYEVGDGAIEYMDPYTSGGYISFYNNPTGNGLRHKTSGFTIPNNRTSLQAMIDDGNVVYHGQKSGTSGVGSLSVIKNANNFYTELPDEIVCTQGTAEVLLRLTYVVGTEIKYVAEDHGTAGSDHRYIHFKTDADGTWSAKNTSYFTDSMSNNTLRWFVENGRAVYHGHTDNTGSAGTHPEIQAASNFEGIIPDGVIMKRPAVGGVFNYQFNYLDADYMYFIHWTDGSSASSYYARCVNDATGSGFAAYGYNTAQYVTPNGETTLQQLIDNGNVVYHGGRSIDSGSGGASSVEQLTDVDVTTVAPSGGQVLVYDDSDSKWKPGAQSSDFVDLTDTPSEFDAGSYLRVNAAGDAIEQVKTAPPDGGLGDNSAIQVASGFDGKLPDQLIDLGSSGYARILDLYWISSSSIYYTIKNQNGYCQFNNNGIGYTNQTLHSGAPQYSNIQDYIDNGQAVYHGQKSGTSGAGSLSVIKNANNFYTELPDEIVHEHADVQYILRLAHIESNYICYRLEDHGDLSTQDRRIYFNNDSDGSPDSTNTVFFTASGNLRWYVENSRAIYHGSDSVTSRIGQLEDITTLIPLANQIDIPDAILARDGGGNLRLLKFTQARSDRFDYQSNTTGSNYLFAFNSSTGAWTGGQHAVNVTKEYDDIQGYIAAGRALYYGRTGSNLDQLVGDIDDLSDVDTSTVAPSGGQVLVYDDSDSKWKPGAQSNDFVDLTDTPATLDAGSYLRVNAAGDAIEQVKTAPPDGGLGGNSVLQAGSNFAGKLPDHLITKHTSGAYITLVLRVVPLPGSTGTDWNHKINYVDESGGYTLRFNNNATGDGWDPNTATHIISPIDGVASPTLQQLIDAGFAVYHGQKSGTSGVGGLSHVKALANSSANGGFYTELPDAIVVERSTDTYNGVFKLHWIKPNSTAGTGAGWEVIYRTEAFDGGADWHISFILDADGTKVSHGSVTHANATTKNLRWYVENGRALYLGGQQDFGVKAWGKFDGTEGSGNNANLTFTGGNIQSITRVSTGLYKVIFINPAPDADYSVSGTANPWGYGGAYMGVRHTYNGDTSFNATTTSFHIEARDSSNLQGNSNRISFQVVY